MIRISVVLVGVTLALLGGLHLAQRQHWISGYPTFTNEILIFLLLGTLINFRYLDRIESPELFVRMYLFMMALKLLAFGAFVVVIILFDKAGAKGNIAFFIITYIIFTGLEVGFLYRKITKQDQPK
jgi:hypothetical protein